VLAGTDRSPLGLAQAAVQSRTRRKACRPDEITLGSIQDLSGPLAGFGKQARLGMTLAVDEINEQGGINGRKLKLSWWRTRPMTPKKLSWRPRSW